MFRKFIEKIKKLYRGWQRVNCGKSNEETIVTGHDTVFTGHAVVPVTYTKTVSKTGVKDQLEFEKSQAVLVGTDRDVTNIRRLDAMIGKLMKPFNGAARVPDKIVSEIVLHIADVSDSLQRTGAYRRDKASGLPSADSGHKTSVVELEYANTYTDPTGAAVEQKIAKFRVGGQ